MQYREIQVNIVSTSGVVSEAEIELGIEYLRMHGFRVSMHPTTLNQSFFYAGTDEQRAESVIQSALNEDVDVIWCARGGYGATHLIPFLEHKKEQLRANSVRKKAIVGYSDVTAILDWFRLF